MKRVPISTIFQSTDPKRNPSISGDKDLLSELPLELQSKVVSQISNKDVQKLSETSKSMQKSLRSNLGGIIFNIKENNIIKQVELISTIDDLDEYIDSILSYMVSTSGSDLMEDYDNKYYPIICYYKGDILELGGKYYPFGKFKLTYIDYRFKYKTIESTYSLNNKLQPEISPIKFIDSGIIPDYNYYIRLNNNQQVRGIPVFLRESDFYVEEIINNNSHYGKKTFIANDYKMTIQFAYQQFTYDYHSEIYNIRFTINPLLTINDNIKYFNIYKSFNYNTDKKDIDKLISAELSLHNNCLLKSKEDGPVIIITYDQRIMISYSLINEKCLSSFYTDTYLTDSRIIMVEEETYKKYNNYNLILEQPKIDSIALNDNYYASAIRSDNRKIMFKMNNCTIYQYIDVSYIQNIQGYHTPIYIKKYYINNERQDSDNDSLWDVNDEYIKELIVSFNINDLVNDSYRPEKNQENLWIYGSFGEDENIMVITYDTNGDLLNIQITLNYSVIYSSQFEHNKLIKVRNQRSDENVYLDMNDLYYNIGPLEI